MDLSYLEQFTIPTETRPLMVNNQPTGLVGVYYIDEINSKNYLGYHTEKYKLVQNKDLIDRTIDIAAKNNFHITEIHRSWSFCDDRRMYLSLVTDKTELINGEEFGIKIDIRNSYDGSSLYAIILSLIRLICRNGAIGYEKVTSMSERHTIGLDDSQILEDFKTGADEINKMKYKLQKMRDKKLSKSYKKRIIENATKDGLIGKGNAETIIEMSDGITNAYEFYNIVTYYFTHLFIGRYLQRRKFVGILTNILGR